MCVCLQDPTNSYSTRPNNTLFSILVVGENKTFQGPEDYVRSRGVKLEIMNDAECISLMEDFIVKNPKLWNEDIAKAD